MAKLTLRFLANLPPHEKKITISTLFTLARMIFIPFIVMAMLLSCWAVACALFATAAVTDIVDGLLARWRNEQTFLGAALDPIADKLLVIAVFCTFPFVPDPLFIMPVWLLLFMLCKEVVIVLGAFLIYHLRGDLEIRPTRLGKTATVIQMAVIMFFMVAYFFRWNSSFFFTLCLGVVTAALTLSLMQYVAIGIRQVRGVR
jgi:cardiolipin synthase